MLRGESFIVKWGVRAGLHKFMASEESDIG